LTITQFSYETLHRSQGNVKKRYTNNKSLFQTKSFIDYVR
jgi:hypothetical protein